jgi:hypothetical protein
MTKPVPDTSNSELDYTQGHRAAWLAMLQKCLQELGSSDPETDKNQWLVEREQAVATLRQVCAEHGDNDWSKDLHLSDVIEKHLAQHL